MWGVAWGLCALGACRERPPARVRLGSDERVFVENARGAVPWRTPSSAALASEFDAARVAIDEAGMVDPARAELRRCASALGFRVGETFFGLDGSPRRLVEHRCEPPMTTAEFARALSADERTTRDPVSRALLLRLGVAEDALAIAPLAPVDRWSTTRAWAERSWTHAVRSYAGIEPDAGDETARLSLGAARYAIGAFERSGADRAAVSRAFPFAALARELDGQQWIVSMRGLQWRSQSSIDRRRSPWTVAPALVLNGWYNSYGEPLLPVSAPQVCSPHARRVPALRFRPSAAWFARPMTHEVLADWTALEGLLRALSNGRSLARVALAPCEEGEPWRPARGYEVAYVMLAAALGYDALAPAEYARFVAGDARLLLDLEARFREQIQRTSPTNTSLARVVLDQSATRSGWRKAAEIILTSYSSAGAQPGADEPLRRNRDAARLIAAARSSDEDRAAQCALLSAALTVDRSIAETHALPIARSLIDSTLPGDRASVDRNDAVRCRLAVLNKLVDAGALEAASMLDSLLTRAGPEVARLEATEALSALSRVPTAIDAWRPPSGLLQTIDAYRWITARAFRLYARNEGLRRWALALLDSQASYGPSVDAWLRPECAQTPPTTHGRRALCLLAEELATTAMGAGQAPPSLAEVRSRAMLWLTPPQR